MLFSLKKVLLLVCIYHSTAFSQNNNLPLITVPLKLKNGASFNLSIPKGYQIKIAAEVKNRLRFLAKSTDGRLFATDMYNRGDNKLGRVLIFDKWNTATQTFDTTIEYLTKLRNPNQVAFYSNASGDFIYVAETGFIKRYRYYKGENKPRDTGTIITRFPDYGLGYKYGGWHLTRSICFYNNKLYVSIGSSCNACVEKEQLRACIIEMNADGSNATVFATGLRNSVAIKFINNQLWVTSMGRDLIGPDKPEDVMHTVTKNGYYGWPFYFQYAGKIFADPQFKDSVKQSFVQKPSLASFAFKAHSAPLGFTYCTNFKDATLNNSFLVALHGSTSVWRERGNTIVQILPNGKQQTFVTGFLQGKTEDKRFGRPCDILQWNENSFFITDDKNGVLYYLQKQ